MRPKTYIFTVDRAMFGCALPVDRVASELAKLCPHDWYDIGNGTFINVGAISHIRSVDADA